MGVVSTAVYLFVLKISFSFDPGSNTQDRPILLMLGLFGLAFLAYFGACFLVMRKNPQVDDAEVEIRRRRFVEPIDIIFIFGIAFRLVLLFSTPIQEVDIYRYIWDGLTTNQGADPYQYPPAAIISDVDYLKRSPNSDPSWPGVIPPTLNQDMEQLVRLAATHEGVEKVLRQVNHSYLTTLYPPVSQWVFAAATGSVPVDSSPTRFIFAIKVVIILFDIGTAVLVVLLLSKIGLPTTWSIVYLWCPLLMKEFANSGHLDSIAVFFCTAGILATVVGLGFERGRASQSSSRTDIHSLIWFSIAGLALALAVGAKLYPVVIFPLWACACCRRGSWRGVMAIGIFIVVAAVLCWPMVRHTSVAKKYYPSLVPTWLQAAAKLPPKREIRSREGLMSSYDQSPSGLEYFSSSWEMNDFLFMIVVENLKTAVPTRPGFEAPPAPWFSLVNQETRIRLTEMATARIGRQSDDFSIARKITLAIFTLIVLWSCVSIARNCDPENFCRLSFLTIAWFWLLSPTQNPWYWSWALPLVCVCPQSDLAVRCRCHDAVLLAVLS